MGMVFFRFPVVENPGILNLEKFGLICGRMDTSPCMFFISHHLKSSFWKSMSLLNYDTHTIEKVLQIPYKQTSSYTKDHNLKIKFIVIHPYKIGLTRFSESLSIMIKIPTVNQIKDHKDYQSMVLKYLLMSQVIYSDINNIIGYVLLCLKINEKLLLRSNIMYQEQLMIFNPCVDTDLKKSFGNGYLL